MQARKRLTMPLNLCRYSCGIPVELNVKCMHATVVISIINFRNLKSWYTVSECCYLTTDVHGVCAFRALVMK